MNSILFKEKYMKYKSKYLQLKNQYNFKTNNQIAGTLSLVTLNAVRSLLIAKPESVTIIDELRTIYTNASYEDKLDLDETAGFILFDLGLDYGTFEQLLNHGLNENIKKIINLLRKILET